MITLVRPPVHFFGAFSLALLRLLYLLRAEAWACRERLKPLQSTLTQAVEFFIKNRPQPEAARLIEELKDEFLKSRKAMNCRPRTLVQYESYLRVICEEFGKSDITQIGREDIEDWLEEAEW